MRTVMQRRRHTVAGLIASLTLALGVRAASAQEVQPLSNDLGEVPVTVSVPPPPGNSFIQYGVALTAEFVAAAGPICDANAPCVLGSGGGIAARAGWRSAGPWYLGGAYEISKQDPNELYRLGVLQQLRAEARYYISTGLTTSPFFTAGLGVAAYGNELAFDTWGPLASVGFGAETQISRLFVVGYAIAYRAILLRAFYEPSSTLREAGVAQIVGLDLQLEGRDPQ
jgi:hypothetical protein